MLTPLVSVYVKSSIFTRKNYIGILFVSATASIIQLPEEAVLICMFALLPSNILQGNIYN